MGIAGMKAELLKAGMGVSVVCACALFLACSSENDEDFFVQRASADEPDCSSSEKSSSSGKSASSGSEEKKSSGVEEKESSGSEGKGSSGSEEKMSSGKEENKSSGNESSSSSESASSTEDSSNSIYPALIFGTCAPDRDYAELNSTVTWAFRWNANASGISVREMLEATYTWTFDDDATKKDVTDKSRNATVSYAASGAKTTSVRVQTSMHDAQTIQCAPLQVQGIAIEGCKCTAESETVDISEGKTAAWSVTGCTSEGAKITGYTWLGEGILGKGTSATATVTAKGESAQPMVYVENDDNTVLNLSCPTVKAIDSNVPDYELTSYGTLESGITFTSSGTMTVVMNLPESWHPTSSDDCTFACSVNGTNLISGSIDGVELSGSYYVKAVIPVKNTIGGHKSELVLDLGGNESATCYLAW